MPVKVPAENRRLASRGPVGDCQGLDGGKGGGGEECWAPQQLLSL